MFAKVFQKMLDSSIWLESDSTVRVWITFLLSMDSEGFCAFASIENLARRARVKPSLTAKAVTILESPDMQSASKDWDGRRIERVAGGWVVLNAKKYREISRHGDLRKTRDNPVQVGSTQRNSEQLGSPTYLSTNGINKSVPETETEKEVEKDIKQPPPQLSVIPSNRPKDSASDVAGYIMQHFGLAGVKMRWLCQDAAQNAMKAHDLPGMGAAARICSEWDAYQKEPDIEFRVGAVKFLEQGYFNSRSKWRTANDKPSKFQSILDSLSEIDGEPGVESGAGGDRQIPQSGI